MQVNTLITSIRNHNYDLVMDYLGNYETIDQMHGAYKNYASHILNWAGDRDILRAPKFRLDILHYLNNKSGKSDKPLSDNYIYAVCLFTRDFFRYCKCVLPEDDTEAITENWINNLVPIRSSYKRLSFNWLSDIDLHKILCLEPEQPRLERAKASILLTCVTGMSRGALLSIPIKEIDFTNLLINQYPEKGVYTEKLASGTTHIYPDNKIIDYLETYTNKLKYIISDDSPWYVRFSKHGKPQEIKFGPITHENQKDAYKFILAPYSKLKEDILTISKLCGIPQITLSIAQNTYIYKMLKSKSGDNIAEEVSQDLLFRNSRPIKQCLKLLNE